MTTRPISFFMGNVVHESSNRLVRSFRAAGESPFVLVGFRPFQFALVGFPGGLGQEAQEVLARSVKVAAHSHLGSRPSRSVPR
jgi:hypothetical protein